MPPVRRILGAAAICLCLPLVTGAAGRTPGPAGQLNSIAPDFTRTDLSGQPLRLEQFKGRVVLLNFWATWCGPCIEEIPVFSGWQRQYGSAGLQILGVSMDDDEAAVRRFVAKNEVPYPIVMGDTKLGAAFGGVYGLPLTLLIDAHGKIVLRKVGELDIEALRARIQALLGIPTDPRRS